MDMRSQQGEPEGSLRRVRRPYGRPTLRQYGSIRELTRGGAPSNVSDHGNNSMSPFN